MTEQIPNPAIFSNGRLKVAVWQAFPDRQCGNAWHDDVIILIVVVPSPDATRWNAFAQ